MSTEQQRTLIAAPAAPPDIRVTTPVVRSLLHKRYPSPEWALLEEVSPGTGARASGYADAVAINLWPSRGHAIHGFEIKVSRSDWLRELKRPEKAEGVFRFCDAWWIVAPRSVVQIHELPPTWGLIEATPGTLTVIKAAPALAAQAPTISFFASIVRRAEAGLEARAAALVRDERNNLSVENARSIEFEVNRRVTRFTELEARVKSFEESTGLKLGGRWEGPATRTIKLAQRLQSLDGYGEDKFLGRLKQVANELETTARVLRAAAETEPK